MSETYSISKLKRNEMMSVGLSPISSIKAHNIGMDLWSWAESLVYVCCSQSVFLASSEATELEWNFVFWTNV